MPVEPAQPQQSPPGPLIRPSRRRRPPGPTEQARRKAWGATWGRRLSDAASELRAKEAR